MYLRWILDQSPTKETWTTIAELKDKEREFKREAIRLRKYLLELHQTHDAQVKLSAAALDDKPSCQGGGPESGGPGEMDHPLRHSKSPPR